MKFKETGLYGAYIIIPEIFSDNRGEFYRLYCENELKGIGLSKGLVQANRSITLRKGTVRGMHFQYPPFRETKIVTCTKGNVYDVIVDIRKGSPTFLQWYGIELTQENKKMIFIPEGFAHGFQTLVDNCELLYFHTEFYKNDVEGGIYYNDPVINIKWKVDVTEISERDKNHPLIKKEFKGI